MSIEQIIKEAASLPDQQRKQLIGQLIALGRSKVDDAEFRRQAAERIDDDDPNHWMSYEELKRRVSPPASNE